MTYIRWGKSSCSNTSGTQLLYSGKVGGSYYSYWGGAAERVCMPEDPDYLDDTAGFSVSSHIYGAEYEFSSSSGPHANLLNYNVPCALCYVSTRSSTIMVPAKSECPSSWTREYYGYLTAQHDSHRRSSFNCVDVNPEGIDSSIYENGARFYYTVSVCNYGLDCPPYESNRILSCAVCTK